MVLVPEEMVTMEPPPRCRHVRDGGAGQEQCATGDDLEHAVPHAEVDPHRIGVEARMAPRRVVVDGVDTAERGRGHLDEEGHRLFLADVTAAGQGTSARGMHVLGDRLGALEVHVAHCDGRTLGGQP